MTRKVEKLEANKHVNGDACWKKISLAESQKAHWKIGPLSLWATRYHNEWKLGWSYHKDPNHSSFLAQHPFTGSVPKDCQFIKRFGFLSTPEELTLRPALADRPCVARPAVPFEIPPRQEVILYISTPLWVRIHLGNHKKALDELTTYRLNDTWVGPSTMEGELCYGINTSARLRLEDLSIYYHRAITAVSIKNNASNPLLLERINLPMPHIALFQSENNLFFTESINLVRDRSGDMAEMKLSGGPLREAGETKKIGEPRVHMRSNIFMKTMNSLFG